MHIIICIALGILVSYAVRTRGSGLGFWRPVAGGVGGALVHAEDIFALLGPGAMMQLERAVSWSPVYVVFLVVLAALALQFLSKKPLPVLLLITALAAAINVVFAFFTVDGVRLLWPLVDVRIAFGVLNTFDAVILGICALVAVLGYMFSAWRSRLAVVGIVACFAYIAAVGTFAWKAHTVMSRYAENMGLEVAEMNALPQPLSPFNWRLIISTQDGRLHDTFVNLLQNARVQLTDKTTRAGRIQALYKPVDEAVWRVYRRLGRVNPPAGQGDAILNAWNALAESPFYRAVRFGVYKGFTTHNNMLCVEFIDLRFEGSRKPYDGMFLSCPTGEAATPFAFYQAESETGFSRLARIY